MAKKQRPSTRPARPRPLAMEAVFRRIAAKTVARAKRAGTLPAMHRANQDAARQLMAREPARQRALRNQELIRLTDYEQGARALQAEATNRLQVLSGGAGDRRPDGTVRFTFRPPVAPRLQAADYVYRLSTHLLGRIDEARWALEQLQQPAPDRLTPAQCRQMADAALVQIERLRARGDEYLQRELLKRARKLGMGRPDVITHTLAALVQADRQAPRRELWRRLAEQHGWLIVSETESGNEELRDAEGSVKLTYPQFEKRIDRAKKKHPPTPA